VVAASPDEEPQIAALHRRASANGVENLTLLAGGEAQALEPNLSCAAALLSGETGIVDSHGYMMALAAEMEGPGGGIAFNGPDAGGRVTGGGFEIDIEGNAPATARCSVVVNSAGLGAHALARALDGLDPRHIPALALAKGSYFSCSGRAAFTRLIYPAPV